MKGGNLWGRHPAHCGGGWLKLAKFTKAEAARRLAEGWTVLQVERGALPRCDCGASATTCTVALGDPTAPTLYECRACHGRKCPGCSGRGTVRDERGRVTDRKCERCSGTGLNAPATVTP